MNSNVTLPSAAATVSTVPVRAGETVASAECGSDEFAGLFKQALGADASCAAAPGSEAVGARTGSSETTDESSTPLPDATAEILLMMGLTPAVVTPPVVSAGDNAAAAASLSATATPSAASGANPVAAVLTTAVRSRVADRYGDRIDSPMAAATDYTAVAVDGTTVSSTMPAVDTTGKCTDTPNAASVTTMPFADDSVPVAQVAAVNSPPAGVALSNATTDRNQLVATMQNATTQMTTATEQRAVDSSAAQTGTESVTTTQAQAAAPDTVPATIPATIPEWLLKGFGDSTQKAREQQMVLALGTELANVAARGADKQADNAGGIRISASNDSINSSVAMSMLGTTGSVQSVQDLSFVHGARHVLNNPVGGEAWTKELGNKLVMLSKQDASSATLHVTPADLGPVQIRIETSQNQASVWFTADHPDTRSAIEQSLPRLREMFSAQGMILNDAGVFGDRSGQQSAFAQTQDRSWSARMARQDADAVDTVTVRTLSLSMLDTYA
jgi:flagellar hook-length control protein FliK